MENGYFDFDAFETELLNAYFKFRSNLPMKDEETGLSYMKSFKTSQDIIRELESMGGVSYGSVSDYMKRHGYTLATRPDGSVAWAIWEKVMPVDLTHFIQ